MLMTLTIVLACMLVVASVLIWRRRNDEATLQEHLFLLDVDEQYRRLHERVLAAEVSGIGGEEAIAERRRRLLEHLYGCGMLPERDYELRLRELRLSGASA
jgi:flagellar biosynthesis/type III secretory pathway M-ring protein FliF/YscJ